MTHIVAVLGKNIACLVVWVPTSACENWCNESSKHVCFGLRLLGLEFTEPT